MNDFLDICDQKFYYVFVCANEKHNKKFQNIQNSSKNGNFSEKRGGVFFGSQNSLSRMFQNEKFNVKEKKKEGEREGEKEIKECTIGFFGIKLLFFLAFLMPKSSQRE